MRRLRGETGRLSGIWGSPGFIPIGDDGSRPSNGLLPYTGTFDGAGHVISSLAIHQDGDDLGLFGALQGSVRNLGLVNVAIGLGHNRAGAIAGTNNGLILNSFATGSVSARGAAGGLVGSNGPGGVIEQSYSSVAVTGVQSDGPPAVGGLAGLNFGTIDTAYANGAVTGGINGGLVGSNDSAATILNSYWNTQLTGQGLACGADAGSLCSAATGLNAAQAQSAASYVGWSMDSAGGQNATWRIYEGQTAPLLKVFLRPITVDAGSTSITYDGTVQTVNAPSPVGIDTSHLLGQGITSGAGRNVGTYALSYAGGYYSDQQGYDLIPGVAAATLTVNPASLTLAAVSDSRTYDATSASTFAPGTMGLAMGDNVTGLTQSFDSRNAGNRTLAVDPGYTIQDGNGGGNYSVAVNSASGNITPAQLTISAVTDTRAYTGTSLSSVAPGVSGLQGNDSVSGLTQSFDDPNAGARTLSVDTGYAVNDGNGGLNYSISATTAAGAINQALLSITANDFSRTYNTLAYSGNNGVTYSGFVNGETASVLGGTLGISGNSQGAINAGSYAITPGGLTASNYAIAFIDGTLTINPAPLTISAIVDSKTYSGTTTSTGAPLVTGLLGNDSASGLSQSFDSANAGSRTLAVNPGYTILDGNAGGNYSVTTVGAVGAITRAALTVTAANATVTYNAAAFNGGNGVNYSGFVNGETSAVLGGTLGFSGTSQGARNVGSYVITPGGLTASNYTISFANGTLAINPALLSLIATADSRTYTGTTGSSLTPNASGLQGSDFVTGLAQ